VERGKKTLPAQLTRGQSGKSFFPPHSRLATTRLPAMYVVAIQRAIYVLLEIY
jgi:hypothetical protein